MTVLRRAFVKVAPDTSTFDRELREKLAKVNAEPAAEKIAKGFSTGLTRRLDKQLKALNLPPIDLKANPKDALAKIAATERALKDFARDASSVELRLKSEGTLSQLGRFRKQLGDAGEGMGVEVGARLGLSTVRGMFAEVSAGFKDPPPQLYAGAGLLAAAMAPTLGAGVAGAVIGGVGVGGVIGGLTLAARDARVQAAGADLGQFILADLTSRAEGFVAPTLVGIERVRSGWISLGPDLDRVFDSERFIDPLVEGGLRGARRFVNGVADLVENADPVMDQFGDSIARVGDTVGDTFTLLAGDAREGASALDDITLAAENFIRTTGYIVHGLAEIKGGLDSFDQQIDSLRYKIEDGPVGALGIQLDLTADGFERGSAEAEAYRRSTLGTATAADEALLAQARYGKAIEDGNLTEAEAQQRALELARAREVEAEASDKAKLAAAGLKAANQTLALSQQDLQSAIDGLQPGYLHTSKLVDGLRQAQDRLYGATVRQADANQSYQASWDSLSESVAANKGTLDVHTAAGRNNRDALKSLLQANTDLYYANIEAGDSTDRAREKHQKRTEAVRKEAERVGLNKTETEKLIATYGRIPPAKQTDLILAGLKGVINAMYDVYLYQRALATGRTIEQIRGGLGKSAEAVKGRAAATSKSYGAFDVGGWTGPGPKMQPAGIVHADEHVIRKESRHSLESARPGGLDYMNQTGRWPGYDRGGTVAPVDESRRWPFGVNIADAFVMSKADAAKRVTPAGPAAGGATLDFMVRVLRQAFPQLSLISGYRPGSMTLTGNLSYHAMRRAVDYPPNWDMARWVNQNYLRRTKEFISPYQEFNILNGRRHTYTGAVWNQHNFAGGNAHNHWAMDNGGYLRPGWNPPFYNGTGQPEPITPAANIEALGRKLDTLTRAVATLVPGIAGEIRTAVGAASYNVAAAATTSYRTGD